MQQSALVTIMWHHQELCKISNHSQAAAKQLAAKLALIKLLQMDKQGDVERNCDCDNEPEERLQAMREWKNAEAMKLKAERLAQTSRRPAHLTYNLQMELDLGREDELNADVKELLIESNMAATFGYDPDLPERPEPTYGEKDEEDEGGVLREMSIDEADSGSITQQTSLATTQITPMAQSSTMANTQQVTRFETPTVLKRKSNDLIEFDTDDDNDDDEDNDCLLVTQKSASNPDLVANPSDVYRAAVS